MSILKFAKKYPKLSSIIDTYYSSNICPTEKLDTLIQDKLINIENYTKTWEDGILVKLSEETGIKAQSLTFGYIPNYGGMLQYKKDLGNGLKAVTQVQFYVSLLANVYTVQVLDIDEKRVVHPFLRQEVDEQILVRKWVSPNDGPTNGLFKKVESFLDTALENPVYLPYCIRTEALKGLMMHHTQSEVNTVGDAFFKQVLPLNKDYDIMGNREYRISEQKHP